MNFKDFFPLVKLLNRLITWIINTDQNAPGRLQKEQNNHSPLIPMPNSIKQPMMETILGFKKRIQFSANLMNHIMQIVRLFPLQ